jgi:23S rRNA (pseudouridine1915-N3)-methyltransferase
MKVTIAAIGRLKAGPEREIAERLMARAEATGRKAGLTFALREFPESRAGSSERRKTEEAEALLEAVPERAVLIALDERGKAIDSRAFSGRLEKWRDGAVSEVVFAIGGADGLGTAILERSELRLAFGTMTWPHQFVRLMLAEQLYRAVTILSGHPYHRA